MSRPSSRLRSEVISQALSLSWKTARATGSRSSTWSVWNRAWRTMRVRAIRTTPKRGLVVVPEVSTEAIELAVQGLWDEGYFHLSQPE